MGKEFGIINLCKAYNLNEENARESLTMALSAFSVDKNPAIENFIQNKMINEQKHSKSRTFLIVNEKTIYAFFTIRLDVLDIRNLDKPTKKKLILKGKSPNNIEYIPCILLEELAKNSNIVNNKIDLSFIVKHATDVANTVISYVGGGLLIINSVNVDKVKEKYENNNFVPFGELKTPKGSEIKYQPMFRKLNEEDITDDTKRT